MLRDRQPSVYSHVTEQKHVKRSYDGIVVNGSGVLHCKKGRACGWIISSWRHNSYSREPRAGEHGLQWSVGSRLTGFEKDKKQSRWNTTTHLLGNFRYVNRIVGFPLHASQKSSTPLAAGAQTQQGFIDERTSLDIPTIADPSRTVDD